MKNVFKKITTAIIASSLTLTFSFTTFAEALPQKTQSTYQELQNTTNRRIYDFTSDGAKGTHEFITVQAMTILGNDKGNNFKNLIKNYEPTLRQYCDKPDKDENQWAFAYHFYNPYTGLNYLPSILPQSKTTALTKFEEHAANAVSSYRTDRTYSMQELGRACHFLEDVNVPYHSANLIAVLSTHSQYEQFVQDHQTSYALNSTDKYGNYYSENFNDYCYDILNDCAKYSYSFKDEVQKSESSWDSVANVTVKYAEGYVAAFFYRFLHEVGEI
ncbi:phospholipase C [Clostridium acetobutylicum]|uniref:Phospholipase C n=1 Tax=Clostridium acetobutylicum (strain ATCC 824 / DSM 792 / JCM 1419 / IAM 19013 / LMG 5710 / NBRC 13948 / NRRL B-527 / VKM B-1787 / 2291 / W) TaxID=272562 RepID=Q97TF6_CLOAB|nr:MULTISPECIES: phospholipase C [Clostridium]AAK76893.1 Phospholipase C [Clostridium acetobutylicum ATCC 824]ADZ22930.1 Phospholipase C [Clostridium acetobutylicum EA 2018]AEI34889.1 phospholipase C [Clostridium acetobutylicum DSM 1731]AWV82435.1 phospholipase C [Clostridium acetobutylicum]MBC2395721.1 phospholipase C [Clostridium acetobutylicum]